jgi:acyl-CoA thioesterase
MTGIGAIIDALEPIDGGWRGRIPDTWLQGRTAYGGVSSALALAVAQRSDDDLPPLRSAQVAFIGPLAGPVVIRARRLRRGRNAAWVQADVESEAGLGLRATFVFMREHESRLDHVTGQAPDFPAPKAATRTFNGHASVPFTQNFEFVDCRDARVGDAEWLRWTRLRERSGLDVAVELIAVADGLPPAALKLLGTPAPLSSMTWQIDLLGVPSTTDGWWLLRADTGYARGGGSSQRMAIWNHDGVAVAEQMQSVAIFA